MGTVNLFHEHRSAFRLIVTFAALLSLLMAQFVGLVATAAIAEELPPPPEDGLLSEGEGALPDDGLPTDGALESDPLPDGTMPEEDLTEEDLTEEDPTGGDTDESQLMSSMLVEPDLEDEFVALAELEAADTCPTGGNNPGDSLEQWANGPPGSEPAIAGQWINGNLNASKSQYNEGDSVGFRRIITGLQAGCEYQVEINYDVISNGLVSYDYLTSWDVTPSVAAADPTTGVSGLLPADGGTAVAFPNDPRLDVAGSKFSGPRVAPREMSIFGGNVIEVLPPTYDNGNATQPYSHEGTTKTSYKISFVAGKANIVLAWGGHIATRNDWSPEKTAPRETNGSPYHMRLTGSIVKEGGERTWNAGNQDRSLKASAVLLPGLNFSKAVLEDLDLTDGVEIPDNGSTTTIDGVKTVELGGSYTYVLTVSNDGEAPAEGVLVTDTLPEVLTIDEVTPDQGTCDTESGVVTCLIGTIAEDSSVEIRIKVTVGARVDCGPIRNDASASGTGIGAIMDSVWVLIDGCAPDLDLVKTASADEVSVDGDGTLTYTLVATNDAEATATAEGLYLTDTVQVPFELPEDAEVTYTIFDDNDEVDGSTDIACTIEGATVTCGPFDLDPGQAIVVEIDVVLSVTADVCDEVTNTAHLYLLVDNDEETIVTWDPEDEPEDRPNSATVEIVDCAADLDLEKSASSGTVSARAGNEVTFTVVGTNAADATATATDVEIVDDLSATIFRVPDDGVVSWAVYDDYDPDDDEAESVRNGTCDVAEGGAEVTCDDIGDLAPGQSVVVTIVAEVTRGNVCATYTNTARLYSPDLEFDLDQVEPNYLEASATVRTVNCTTFTPNPDIELTKTVDPTEITLTEGDVGPFEVTYTYTVENTGNVSLSALALTDDVLGSLTAELLTALGGTTLLPGAETTFEVDYALTAGDIAAGGVTNIATVSGTGGGQTVTDTDDATVDVTIVAGLVSELQLVKTALVTPNSDGDKVVSYDADGDPTVITYEYEITNAGTSTLTITFLEDDVIGVIDLPDELVLEAGESATVTAAYTVTAQDADAGEVVNVAIVTAVDEGGQTLTADDDETVGVVEMLDVIEEKPKAKPLAKTGVPVTVLILLGAMLSGLGAVTVRRTPRRSGGIRG